MLYPFYRLMQSGIDFSDLNLQRKSCKFEYEEYIMRLAMSNSERLVIPRMIILSAEPGRLGMEVYDAMLISQIDEGLARIVEAPLGTYHNIQVPMEGELKISVNVTSYNRRLTALLMDEEFPPRDSEGYIEKMTLEYNGRVGICERSVAGHHGVQTGSRGSADFGSCVLIVKVDEDDPILDRGVCWIYQGKNPIISIGIDKDKKMAFEDIKGSVYKAMTRTVNVISDIINGNIEGPAPRKNNEEE